MAQKQRGPKSKHWCFTLNNPRVEEEGLVDQDLCTYGVVGNERGEKHDVPHFQGYIEFKNRMEFSGVKKLLKRAHWEARRGTSQEASDYCKKDGDFVEFGELSLPQGQAGGKQQAKNWEEARDLAKAGRVEEVPANIYLPFYNTIKRIATDHQPKVAPMAELDNEWHCGPTGTGKSRGVREKYPEAFIKDANRWWDGYQNEAVVIIEDVDKYDVKLGRYFKLWGDHYAFPADMKNQGKRDIRPRKVIITSNYLPEEIWDDEKTWQPIRRRYKVTKYLLPLVAPPVTFEVDYQ